MRISKASDMESVLLIVLHTKRESDEMKEDNSDETTNNKINSHVINYLSNDP